MDVAKTGGVFFLIVLVLEDLGWWHGWDSWDLCDPPSPSLRRDRPYGSQRSHRVSGGMHVPGALMLFNFRARARRRGRARLRGRYCPANAASTAGGKISMTSPSNRNVTAGS